MQGFVFAAVLFAAACHAGWNALIKLGSDPLSTATLLAVGSAAVGLICLPIFGMPASASWPWLIGSAIIHFFYFAALIESYRGGDLGQVYPLARGTAPLHLIRRVQQAATTTFVRCRLHISRGFRA